MNCTDRTIGFTLLIQLQMQTSGFGTAFQAKCILLSEPFLLGYSQQNPPSAIWINFTIKPPRLSTRDTNTNDQSSYRRGTHPKTLSKLLNASTSVFFVLRVLCRCVDPGKTGISVVSRISPTPTKPFPDLMTKTPMVPPPLLLCLKCPCLL